MKTAAKTEETIALMIWGQALIAMLGSLFYSEVMGYIPCSLCWYQRILMYPLVAIYGVYAFKKDRELSITLPGLIMSGIGIIISTSHYLIQKVPAFQDAGSSCGLVPCNAQYVNYFGFITIPFMAGVAFLVIFILNIILFNKRRKA